MQVTVYTFSKYKLENNVHVIAALVKPLFCAAVGFPLAITFVERALPHTLQHPARFGAFVS